MAKVKKTVIINKKMYKMPSWNFRDIRRLEACGLDLMKIQNAQEHIFGSLAAFIAVTANIELEEADALIESHVENGGDIRGLLNDFFNSLGASPFFSRMLENIAKEVEKTETPEDQESENENA